MANGGNRFALLEKGTDKFHGFRQLAKLVGIHHPAGQQQCVVIITVRMSQQNIHLDRVAEPDFVPGFDDVAIR